MRKISWTTSSPSKPTIVVKGKSSSSLYVHGEDGTTDVREIVRTKNIKDGVGRVIAGMYAQRGVGHGYYRPNSGGGYDEYTNINFYPGTVEMNDFTIGETYEIA